VASACGRAAEWSDFVVGNLLPVTIGNIVGAAILVGLVYWFVYLRGPVGAQGLTGRRAMASAPMSGWVRTLAVMPPTPADDIGGPCDRLSVHPVGRRDGAGSRQVRMTRRAMTFVPMKAPAPGSTMRSC
jgi:hypothetical protein